MSISPGSPRVRFKLPAYVPLTHTGMRALLDGQFETGLLQLERASQARGRRVCDFGSPREVLARIRLAVMSSDPRLGRDPSQTSLWSAFERLPEFTRLAILVGGPPGAESLRAVVTRQRRALESHVRAIRAVTNLIAKLPPEIWSHIGRELVLRSSGQHSRHGFRLVGVCRYWREVLVHDPVFWTNIFLGQTHYRLDGKDELEEGMQEMWATVAALTDSQALYVLVDAKRSGQRPTLPWELLAPVAARLESLTGMLRGDVSLSTVWRAVEGPTSILKYLDIQAPRYAYGLDLPSFPLPCLVELDLGGVEFADPVSLYPLLQRMPTLQFLYLFQVWNMHLLWPSTDGRGTLELPHLRVLHLEGSRSSVENHEEYVFLAPELQQLHLLYNRIHDGTDLKHFLFPAGHPPNTARLQCLRVWYSTAAPGRITNLIEYLPLLPVLDDLEFHHTTRFESDADLDPDLEPDDEADDDDDDYDPTEDEDQLLEAIVIRDKGALCPKLHTLNLRLLSGWVDQTLLRDVVETRPLLQEFKLSIPDDLDDETADTFERVLHGSNSQVYIRNRPSRRYRTHVIWYEDIGTAL